MMRPFVWSERGAEYRALWVNAFNPGIKSPQEVDGLIRHAQSANLNVIIAQVRKRGDAYFRGREPRAADWEQTDYDPLAYLVERAHAANPRVQVYAWVNIGTVAKNAEPPTAPEHLFNQHGAGAPEAEMWLSKTLDDVWVSEGDYFLDLGHPAAAQYTVDVLLDLIRDYDVDGIHFDYVRYPGLQWGYNPTSAARFNALYNTTGKPSALDSRWSQWRRDQVTHFVRQMYLETIAVKPELKVSAALIAWGAGPKNPDEWRSTSAYSDVFQDWHAWVDEGILDLAVPMNYDRESDAQQRQWFDRWIEWEKRTPGERHLAVGIGAFLNEIDATSAQTVRAIQPTSDGARANGVSFYAYSETSAHGLSKEKFFGAFVSAESYPPALFGQNVPTPEMTWKTRPARGYLKGFARNADGAAVTLEGAAKQRLVVSGTGFFGAVNLMPGDYTLTLSHEGQAQTTTAAIRAGQVTTIEFSKTKLPSQASLPNSEPPFPK